MSDRERRRLTSSPAYVSEIGLVGGTSTLAQVRARQMARQREISSRKVRTEDYLKNLYEDEEREKQEEKERARAKASHLEEQRIDQLAARADRIRLRTEDPLPLVDKKPIDPSGASSEIPYAVRRQRRREEQYRRQSDERREQVSKDLARARALLDQERKRDDFEMSRDVAKSYGSYGAKRSGLRDDIGYRRGEPATTSILKTTNRRHFELDNDYQPLGRSRLAADDHLSDYTLGRSNGLQRDLGASSSRPTSSRLSNGIGSRPKEVHWDDF